MAATLDNFEAVETALKNMENSAGNADAEMEIITNSLEYKINALKETGTGIAQNLFKRDDMKAVISALTQVLNVIDKVTGKLGLFKTIGAGVGLAGLGKGISSIKTFASAWKTLSEKSGWDNLRNSSKILATIGDAFPNLSKRIEAFSTAFRGAMEGSGTGVTKFLAGIKGIGSGLNAFLGGILPVTIALGALTLALMKFNETSHQYTDAVSAAKESSSEYVNAKSDLETLTSEYDTQKQKIQELNALKASGDITIAQQNELDNLLEQNKALEVQLQTQQKLAELRGAEAAQDVRTAMNTEKSFTESEQDKHGKVLGFISGLFDWTTTDENGALTTRQASWNNADTTQIGITKSNLSLLADYEQQLAKINKQLARDPDNEGLLKQQQRLQESISSTKSEIADSYTTLQTWKESLTGLDGNPLEGYEKEFKAIKEAMREVEDYGKSTSEKAYSQLTDFFSTGSNSAIKERLMESKDLEKTLGNLGLKLSDLGDDVDAEFLKRYFDEIKTAADEAAESVDKVNNNISVSEAAEALSDNSKNGSSFATRYSSMQEADELYDQGLYNNSAFKTFTESITYGADDTREGYEKAMKKLKRYYTTAADEYEPLLEKQQEELKAIETSLLYDSKNADLKAQKKAKQAEIKETKSKISSEGSDFTTDGMYNFLEDLGSEGFAELNKETGKWEVNLSKTAKAAKALGISTADLETLADRLQEYDIADVFHLDENKKKVEGYISSFEKLDDAQSSLDALMSAYNSMEDGADKDALAKKLFGEDGEHGWKKVIADAQNDLASLPDKVVTELQFEYDKQTLKNLANQAMEQANVSGWKDVTENATAIITAQNYRDKMRGSLDLDSIKTEVPVYFQTQSAINQLKEQLASGKLDEETTIKVQAQIANLTNLQAELLESFGDAHPEITPETDPEKANETFLEWINSAEGQQIALGIGLETKDALDAISEITGVKIGNIEVPISLEGYGEFSDTLAKIKDEEITDKVAKIIAEDGATGILNLYNSLSANDKFSKLSAEDQATFLIETWNQLTPEQKEAVVDGKVFIDDSESSKLDETTAKAGEVEASDPNVAISTNASEANAAIGSVSISLSNLNGRVATTTIRTITENIVRNSYEDTGTGAGGRGATRLSGTAHLGGTAYKGGSSSKHKSGYLSDRSWIKPKWRTKKTERALIGEKNQEIVATKDGYWYTVGDDGAEFQTIPAGSVVFNATQTRQLLSSGKITGRGRTHLSGTAFSSGTADFSSRLVDEASAFGKSHLSGTAYASGTSDGSSSSEKEFDFVEIQLKRIKEAIDRVKIATESAYKTLATRNKSATSELILLAKQIDAQNNAYNRYMQAANAVGLSSSWVEKIKNGSLDISTITDETLSDQISDFQTYYEKAIEAKDAVAELHEEVAKLYSDKFNNIADDFENQLSLVEHLTNTYKTGLDKLEAEGLMGSTKYYEALQAAEKENQEILTKELAELTESFTEAMDSGEIAEQSEQWYEFQKKINDVKEAIDESVVSLKEYQKSLRELDWEFFDFMEDRISTINDEASFLIDLMSNGKLYEDNGDMTDTGKASVALRGQNYNVYMAQADQYRNEAEAIAKELESDPYNTDLLNRREELLKLQRESILSAESEKKAIADLVENGIEKQISSLKELISLYTDSLDSAQDLYSYQKNVAKQTAEIASLQKQISAYKNDTSQEARATVQKLEISLKESQEELAETEFDQFVTEQKKLLDQLTTDYETYMNTRLDDMDVLISETMDTINQTGSDIMETLKTESANVGYSMSESLNTIWSNEGGANAIVTKYGDNFLSQLTTVNQALGIVSTYVAGLQAKADAEAKAKAAATKKTTAKTTSSSKSNNSSSNSSSSKNNTKFSEDIKKGIATAIWVYGGDGSGWGNDPVRSKRLTEKFGATNAKAVQDYINAHANNGDLYNYWVSKGRNVTQYNYNKFATGLRKSPYDQDAWINELGTESVISPTNRAIVTHINKGDSVLTAEATKNIWDMANDPSAFISGKLANNGVKATTESNNGDTYNMDNININMPGVKSYSETVETLRRDPQFENIVQAMTVGRSKKGSSKLDKYKY